MGNPSPVCYGSKNGGSSACQCVALEFAKPDCTGPATWHESRVRKKRQRRKSLPPEPGSPDRHNAGRRTFRPSPAKLTETPNSTQPIQVMRPDSPLPQLLGWVGRIGSVYPETSSRSHGSIRTPIRTSRRGLAADDRPPHGSVTGGVVRSGRRRSGSASGSIGNWVDEVGWWE